MSAKVDYKINISPVQLMGFNLAMVVIIMGMVYATSTLILNGQRAAAQTNQSNTGVGPKYVLSEDAASCSEPVAHSESEGHAVGSKVHMNGKTYRVVGVVPVSQVNQDNDTTTTYSVDNRNSGNTDNRNSRNTDNRNSGNSDSRFSGNTLTDNRNSGNTDSRFSGNTVTTNLNSGNTTTTSTETTTVDNRNRDNTLNNTNTSNNGNTTNSGNTTNQNNGNTNTQNSGNTTTVDDPLVIVL